MSRSLASGTYVPTKDLPEGVGAADAPLTPNDFNIPEKNAHSPEEFGNYFDVSVDTIYREIKDGSLRAAMVRGGLRIPHKEIAHYLIRQGIRFRCLTPWGIFIAGLLTGSPALLLRLSQM